MSCEQYNGVCQRVRKNLKFKRSCGTAEIQQQLTRHSVSDFTSKICLYLGLILNVMTFPRERFYEVHRY